MTPLDEAPEQRWRRTVDRRNKPAKLKVDRLLRDFGYTELDPEVGDAIEARLAAVALTVAPSLRDAVVDEVVTIYANERTAPDAAPVAQAGVSEPVPAEEPAVASDVAQMVSYLKQQVLDARAEAARLRVELDRRVAARTDAEREAQATIAEQAATLEAQSRQIAELSTALNATREALAETRDEIRRAVGELQALPEPSPVPFDAVGTAPLIAEEAAPEGDDADDDFDLDGEEPAEDREAADAARLASELRADELLADDEDDLAAPALAPADEPLVDIEEPAVRAEEPAFELEEPALGAGEPDRAAEAESAFEPEQRVLGGEADPFELEPVLGGEAGPFEPEEPVLGGEAEPLELEPVLGGEAEPFEPEEPALAGDGKPAFELEQPAPLGDAERRLDVEEPALTDVAGWQPDAPAPRGEHGPEVTSSSALDEPAAGERAADLDAALPPSSEWLPADLRPQADGDERAAAAEASPTPVEPEPGDDDLLTDFDDFLYDADELYDPAEAATSDAPGGSEGDALWPDASTSALPPPPPVPPSPWVDQPGPREPVVVERATLGKALRSRGGRGRGRWHGSCSICGREPAENKRKDLEAAGWDLDDEAAACPQCRGVG